MDAEEDDRAVRQEPEPDDTEPVLAAVEEQTPPASPVNAWRIAALVGGALLIVWVLYAAASALVRVATTRPDGKDGPATTAAAEPAGEKQAAPAKVPRKPMDIPALYID